MSNLLAACVTYVERSLYMITINNGSSSLMMRSSTRSWSQRPNCRRQPLIFGPTCFSFGVFSSWIYK